MDFCTNIHVQNGFNNLLALLDEIGFRFGTYVWDPKYKDWMILFWRTKTSNIEWCQFVTPRYKFNVYALIKSAYIKMATKIIYYVDFLFYK